MVGQIVAKTTGIKPLNYIEKKWLKKSQNFVWMTLGGAGL
jgi:hypothetical protein